MIALPGRALIPPSSVRNGNENAPLPPYDRPFLATVSTPGKTTVASIHRTGVRPDKFRFGPDAIETPRKTHQNTICVIYRLQSDRHLRVPENFFTENSMSRLTCAIIVLFLLTSSAVLTGQESEDENPKSPVVVPPDTSGSDEKTPNEKFEEDEGESRDFTGDNLSSDQLRELTLGGGAGGDFGRGRGGHQKLLHYGGSRTSQRAVLNALIWLARHQADDGRWDAYGYINHGSGNGCERFVTEDQKKFNVGITGLALLAYFGAGYTHLSSNVSHDGHNFGHLIKRGLFWLKMQQNTEGVFNASGEVSMYNHALATWAYAEVYGMTGAPMLKDIVQRGVDYLVEQQNKTSSGSLTGWGTQPGAESNTVVTGLAAFALYAAQLSGLHVPDSSRRGALQWIKTVSKQNGATVHYSTSTVSGHPMSTRAGAQTSPAKSTMTAIGMLVRMTSTDSTPARPIDKGARTLMKALRKTRTASREKSGSSPMDDVFLHHATLAIFNYAGPGSPNEGNGMWTRWNRSVKRSLLERQESGDENHEHGSWDPTGRLSQVTGRVYVTALNALTLETYYRFRNFYNPGGK